MPVNGVYSPPEVYALILKVWQQRTGKTNPSVGVLKATYIVLRESGGNPTKRRPASQNPDGGNDRGLWQFNDKWFPDVSDLVAYDPILSTHKAFEVSKQFTDFKPWETDRDPEWGFSGSEHQQDALRKALDAFFGDDGQATITTSVNPARNVTLIDIVPLYKSGESSGLWGPIGTVVDAAGNIVDTAGGVVGNVGTVITEGPGAFADAVTPDWMGTLGNLLKNLVDPGWWKRIGIGAVALLIIIVALVLYFRNSVKETITDD